MGLILTYQPGLKMPWRAVLMAWRGLGVVNGHEKTRRVAGSWIARIILPLGLRHRPSELTANVIVGEEPRGDHGGVEVREG